MSEYESLSLFWNKMTLLVLFLTLVALGIYTWFTKKIHETSADQLKELTRQRRLGVMPSILVQYTGIGFSAVITNIGNGPALNVKILPLIQGQPQQSNEFGGTQEIGLLRPSETKPLLLENGDSKIAEEELRAKLSAMIKNDNCELLGVVRFHDIEGSLYEQPLPKIGEVRIGFVKLIEEGQGATLIADEGGEVTPKGG